MQVANTITDNPILSNMRLFSIIIPVYNRPNEVRELLESLSKQRATNFEVIIVEDGSTHRCLDEVERYNNQIKIAYYYKENEERSIARNYGMERANGDYFLFFDSDCVIPEHYIETLTQELETHYTDCFGGPDGAHTSFSNVQKAINYAMTSFLTTGGIRGGKVKLEKFTPRSFNMGFSRKVFERVGGFSVMMSEDIDISTRIKQAGFSIQLIRSAYVYHKRRVNLRLFWKQVYGFGSCRVTLYQLYPDSLRIVYLFPTLFVLGSLFLLTSTLICPYAPLPLGLYFGAICIGSTIENRSLKIGILSIITSFIQLAAYGVGFMNAFVQQIILGKKTV